MADTNRLELDIVALDDTAAGTSSARRNFRSLEQEELGRLQRMGGLYDAYGVRIARSFDQATVNMGRSADRAAAGISRSLQALEQRAALAGKSGVDRLLAQRSIAIDKLGGDEAAVKRTAAAFDALITARQKYDAQRKKGDETVGTGNPRRLLLAAKDALEGYSRGTAIEVSDYFIGTGGQGGLLRGAFAEGGIVSRIAAFTGLSSAAVVGISALAVGFGVLEVAGLKAEKALGEVGEKVKNFSLRTGIPGTQYQAFEYAAKSSGQDVSIFEKATRGLGQLADDNSPAGNQARREAERLGVHFRDQFGDLKPTQDMLLELADGFNRLPAGVQRSAASMEIFKRLGIELVPVLSGLRENLQRSEGLGSTFTDADLKLFEEFHRTMLDLGTEWERLKLHIEEPIAVTVSFINKGIGTAVDFTKIPSEFAKYLYENGPGYEEPPPPDRPGSPDQRGSNRLIADTEIRARQSQEGIRDQIEAARKKLQETPAAKLGESTPEQTADYYAAKDRLHELEETQKAITAGSQDQIALDKERLQIASQLAEVKASSELRDVKEQIDRSKELATTEDRFKILALTRERVDRETEQKIGDRRYIVDENGNRRDLIGDRDFQKFAAGERALEPKRLELETAKVLADFEQMDNRYFLGRREALGKSYEEETKLAQNAHRSLISEIDKLDTEQRNRYFQRETSDNERDKNLALSQLGLIDAQSVKEKIALEDQKLAIETAYAERSLQIQIEKIRSDAGKQYDELLKQRNIAGPNGEAAYEEAKGKVDYAVGVDVDEARKATAEKELIQAQDVANKKTQLAISEDRKIFDSLKQSANGLFDALFEKSKSFADVLKGLFKTAILTPIKDIFSSQVAGLFTELLTGQKVTFNEVGSGQGRFGRLGSILGRAGLGTPHFGQPGDHLSNLNLPNHLGDAQLVSGAVPVVVINGGSQSLAVEAAGGGVQGLARSLVVLPQILGSVSSGTKALSAAAGVAPVALKRLQESVGSAISYSNGAVDALSFGNDQFVSDYLAGQLPVQPPYQNETVGYDSLDNYNSRDLGSDGSPGSEGVPVEAGAAAPSRGGGFFSHISGLFGGAGGAGLFGKGGLGAFFGKTPVKPSVVTDPFGNPLPNAPALSGLKALQGSPAASLGAAIGFGLALKGIQQGGIGGTLEAAGGGALVGFKFGGPVGAVIGAAIGGGAALIRSLFGDERGHTKDLVKQIYGIKINDSTADAIIAIAKQKYGGAISIAVRSQEVRDLLKLYAETLGDKRGQAQFVNDKIHSASLIESGGKLYQQAIYDNGSAYAYSSPLSTYGGVNTSPLPTSARDSGGPNIGSLQLVVNGQSASDLLAGQVANTATPGFIQGRVLSASSSSNGRLNQTALTVSPNAITR